MSKYTSGYQRHQDYVSQGGKYSGQKLNLTTADKGLLRDKGQLELRKEIATKQYKSERRQSVQRVAGAMDGKSIFTIILAFLLLYALIAGLTGTQDTRSFAGLLQFLQEAPDIDMSWVKGLQVEWGDWGALDFLRQFLQGLWFSVSSFLYIGTALVNTVIYFAWLVGWLFIGH